MTPAVGIQVARMVVDAAIFKNLWLKYGHLELLDWKKKRGGGCNFFFLNETHPTSA